MSNEPRIYVYAEQIHAAKSLLEEAGLAMTRDRLRPVSDADHLRGVNRGTFVIVEGHPRRVPADILECAWVCGMTQLRLDDTARRVKGVA